MGEASGSNPDESTMGVYKTVTPVHGDKEHIITRELKDGTVTVACGHTHMDIHSGGTKTHTEPLGDNIEPDLCSNCVDQVTTLRVIPKKY